MRHCRGPGGLRDSQVGAAQLLSDQLGGLHCAGQRAVMNERDPAGAEPLTEEDCLPAAVLGESALVGQRLPMPDEVEVAVGHVLLHFPRLLAGVAAEAFDQGAEAAAPAGVGGVFVAYREADEVLGHLETGHCFADRPDCLVGNRWDVSC